MKKNPGFSLITITGLSLTMILIILLLTWISFETGFDRFHVNAKKISRVVVDFNNEGSIDRFANTPAPLGEALKNKIPEITDYVRFAASSGILIRYNNKQFYETIMYADPSIFRVFSFELKSGDPGTALVNPGSIILDETTSAKYFGNADPVGKTIILGENQRPYLITGVLKDVPLNSQLQFRILCSFSLIKNNLDWGMWNYSTYILASDEGSYSIVNKKVQDFAGNFPEIKNSRLYIQPLLRIHLHSNLRSDLSTNTDIKTIYIAAAILFLVLVVACINYMNLATARYTVRGKEAGIRKVAGAGNSDLRRQFLSEAFAVTTISFLLGFALSYFLLPFLDKLVDWPVNSGSMINLRTITILIFLLVIISLISGSYPAVILSSVNPVSAIRSEFIPQRAASLKNFRRSLVIFQFLVSIILITGTLVIKAQMKYIRNKDLGLVPDQVLVIPIYQAEVNPKYEIYKKEILNNPDIISASAVCYFPGKNGYYQNVWWEGLDQNNMTNMMSWIPVDQDFIKTLKIELIGGEDFGDVFSDERRTYILNKSAAKMIGWDDPLGKQMDIIGKGRVIGIVKDFNFKSLHSGIEPVALTYYPAIFDNMMIRISSIKIKETINFLNETWNQIFPGTIFEYSFLDEDFQRMYKEDTMVMRIVTIVSIISLFISCIGLFGLVIFTTSSKTKEIGIRKVSGSTSQEIISMLNMQFVKWILISFIISIPVVIFFSQKWLEKFAYRIRLEWWFPVSALVLTLAFSLVTISWHTWNIARKNPVDCLRHE